MFSNADKKQAVQVQLALNDGRSLAGKIICPADSNLLRILNGETGFLDFIGQSGVKSIVAKSAIVELVIADAPV